MTCGWTGVCRPVFKKVPSSNYRKLPSYPLLWWILAENHPFSAIFHQFLDNPPLFMENLPKKGPLFREFGAQKPTHMGGTYPYPQHVMYPPPGAEWTPWYTSMKCAQNLGPFGSHYGFYRWLGNANRRKMAFDLMLILQKMNWEIENKHFADLIWSFLKVFKQ